MTIKQQGGIFGRNPTFNDVEVDGSLSGTTVDLVNSGGSTQTALTLTNNSTSFAAGSAISFKFDSDSQEYTQIEATPRNGSQGKLLVKNLLGGSLTQALTLDGVDLSVDAGNLIIGTSGKGIDFSATSGTGTSELFDDYEEGTWTPVPSDATSGGNVGTGTISGLYTKVGNIVTAQFRIVNLNTTGMTAGNALRIQGLPFTSLSGSGNFVGSLDVQNVTFSDGISLQNSSGQSYLTLRELASSGAGSNLIVSDCASGSADVFGSITYTAA